jgi:MoxR-like ATPase
VSDGGEGDDPAATGRGAPIETGSDPARTGDAAAVSGIDPLPPDVASALADDVIRRVREAVVTDRATMEPILAAILARGHVLIEDVPGTGKTLAARTLAAALGLSFTRIQFTPDLLPADVTGTTVYREGTGEFEFSPGPIFGQVVLADELNRAPPKTQAALFEAMEERQVSVDGETHPLPDPFVVIATQNPVDQAGTFELPAAERDRFAVRVRFGYPDEAGELELLDRRAERRTLAPTVEPATGPDAVRRLRLAPEAVRVDPKVRRYLVDLGRATRADDRTDVGVSPRGIQRAFELVRARAALAGRDYAVPDDVNALAVAAFAHRLVLTTEAGVEGISPEQVVRDALDATPIPDLADTSDDASTSASHADSDPPHEATDGPPEGATQGDTGPSDGPGPGTTDATAAPEDAAVTPEVGSETGPAVADPAEDAPADASEADED